VSSCSEGYPKTFGEETITKDKIEVYHYDAGSLTLARSFSPGQSSSNRTVVLINESEMSDSYHPVNIDYQLIDGCIVDFRDFQRMRINENCTKINADYLSVGINGSTWVDGVFEDCTTTDDMVIADIIDFYAQSETFDSVYVTRFSAELDLLN
jgi:hypothetical protein